MSTSPQLLGKYELRARLGETERAETWQAFDPQEQRDVAIKILHVDMQADPAFPARFTHEATRLLVLRHPNIVQVRDFGVSHSYEAAGPIAYLVTDFVDGQTLADYIHDTAHQGKFPSVAEVVRLLIPVSLAIDYAHQLGIIHGDLKPTNILLDKSNTSVNPMGQPILSDFGITRLLNTPNRSLVVSSYTSPEQLQGYADNERSDLYALAAILYELFTGVPPFQGDDPSDTMTKQLYATPVSPALLNPNILPALTAVILRGLAKNPAERFASTAAMVVAMARTINMPVPEQLRQAAASTSTNVMNQPTFLSPLPASRPLGATPSSPSWPGGSSPSGAIPTVSAPMPVVHPQVIAGTPLSTPATTPAPSQGQTVVQQASPATYPAAPPHMLTPSSPQAPPPRDRRRRNLYTALVVVLLVVLLGSGLGAYLVFFRPTSTAGPVVGHAFFASSGLLATPNSSQGITDQLQLHLQNIPDPQPGKSYYAWLLNDKKAADSLPILLGRLQVYQGAVNLFYPGDSQHSDLLATYSRLLVTEEDASTTPTNPSLDNSTWRYYAEFPTTANSVTHFSVLDHLRHLLAQDPKLKAAGLSGGLDIWLFRNTEKVLEWSGSAKDTWSRKDGPFIHRQVVRILDYLDGSTYVTQEVPPGTPLLVDPTIARVALLEFDVQHQEPPGYLFHIGKHLREITESPDVAPTQVTLAIQINRAIDNVQFWLNRVHKDALQLVNMSNAQLLQSNALTLLDDMATSANNAFAGQIDPTTNQVVPGVVQIHYNIQRLATFDITPCSSNGGTSNCSL